MEGLGLRFVRTRSSICGEFQSDGAESMPTDACRVLSCMRADESRLMDRLMVTGPCTDGDA